MSTTLDVFLFALWLLGCLTAAWGIVAAGYNGDDGWSVLFLLMAGGMVWIGFGAGWLG